MSRRSSLPDTSPTDPNSSKPKRIRRNRRALLKVGIVPRGGSLDASEKSSIAEILQGEIVPAQIDALAIAMRREPGTIEKYVLAAKDKFLQNASKYADIHAEVATRALAEGSPKGLDVARKASEFAMVNTSTKDSAGKEIRIIDSPGVSSSAPVIKIGIALGGLPSARNDNDEQ